MKPSWTELRDHIVSFRDERNWKQFHTPKNLATAISIEAAELQECFLWQSEAESQRVLEDADKRQAIAEEIADVIIYSILFAESMNLDVGEIVKQKVESNARRYPVEKSKGNYRKYTEP